MAGLGQGTVFWTWWPKGRGPLGRRTEISEYSMEPMLWRECPSSVAPTERREKEAGPYLAELPDHTVEAKPMAPRRAIQSAIDWLIANSNEESHVVFFSGRGYRVPDEEG